MNRLSNIKISGQETDINFRSLSYDESFNANYNRNIKNANNNDIRKKVFEAYSQLRSNFPKGENPAGEVQTLCRQIINAFYDSNRTNMTANFNTIPDVKLEALAIKTKDLFKRLMGIGNVVLCFDKSQVEQPIKIFFDVVYNYQDMNSMSPDPLAFRIDNGFFRFISNNDKINLTVIINLEYIRNLMNKNYTLGELDPKNPEPYELEYQFSSNYYLKINDIVNRFWRDFLGAFTLALYKDRYREATMATIYAYFYLLNEEKKSGYQLFYANNRDEFLNFLSTYRPFVQNMGLCADWKTNKKEGWNYPNIEEFIGLNHWYRNVDFCGVNPIDLYNALFEPLQIEISTLIAKLRIYQTLDAATPYAHLDPRLDDLNMNYMDDTTNLTVSCVLLKRLVPFIIFTEMFINDGSKYIELRNFLDRLNSRLIHLKSLVTYSIVTKCLTSVLENVEKDRVLVQNTRSMIVSKELLLRLVSRLAGLKDEEIEIEEQKSSVLEEEVLGVSL